jgi:hypothetical protein
MDSSAPSPLTLAEFAADKGFSVEELTRYGVRESWDRIEIPYRYANGLEYERCRIRAARGFAWTAGSAPVIPYGLWRPVPVTQGRLFIVEGESDCWALWAAGIPALGIPGATSTGCLAAEHLEGVREIGVVREPDAAGGRFPARIARRAFDVGYTGTVSAVSFAPYKDPRAARQGTDGAFLAFARAAWRNGERIERPTPPAGATEFITTAQVLAQPDEVRYCIDGLLPASGSLLVGAKKKVGKSVLLLNAAKAVARGEPFLGRRTQQGRVLYVSIDEPKTITRSRIAAMGFVDADPIDWFFDRRGVPPDWAAWLSVQCARVAYGLIIVDTIAKLVGVREMNDYAEWNRALTPLHGLSERFGLSWIGSAHNRKEGQGTTDDVAGSMAITAGVDTIVLESKNPDGTRIVATEQRHGNDLEPTVLTMDEQTYGVQLGDERWLARRRAVGDRIVALLTDGRPRAGAELVHALQARKADVFTSLDALLSDGVVVRGRDKRYSVPAAVDNPVPVHKGTTGEPQGNHRATLGTAGTAGTEACVDAGDCGFFLGEAGAASCGRCGRSWEAHYRNDSNA